ncbi:MAG: TspO/MBR family protein [Phocaeicola sp.]
MKYTHFTNKRGFFSLLLPILLCLLVGFIGSQFQKESIQTWYPTLNKSYMTPPSSLFPIAWTTLYIFMGVSVGLVGYSRRWRKHWLVTLFAIQLLLNCSWSILFFYLQSPFLGMINILFLDLAVFVYIVWSYPRHRISSILFMPYLLWLLFASYLNFYIWYYN